MINPNLLATTLTPTTAAPAPAPAPVQGSCGEPGAFGRELQRAETTSQAESTTKSTAESRADQVAAERQRGERRTAHAGDRRAAGTGKPATASDGPSDGRPDSADHAAALDDADVAAPDAAATAGSEAASTDTNTRPDLANWVAQLAQRLELARERAGGSPRGSSSPADGPTDGRDAAIESSLIEAARGAPQPLGAERWPAAAADRARAVGVRAEAQAAPGATTMPTAEVDTRAAFGALLGDALAAAAGARSDAGRTDGSPVPATATASAAATGNDTAASAAPASIAEDSLAPAVGSREFAQALGARVAVFARDGVEHARLNLHPADLGPISLKLALDGTQLRVDMSAEAAQTRQVLEQSLPGLASALRDAGLTLSGGGVFQQSRDRSSGFGEPAQPGRSGTQDADVGAASVPDPMLVSRPVRLDGLVDLYA